MRFGRRGRAGRCRGGAGCGEPVPAPARRAGRAGRVCIRAICVAGRLARVPCTAVVPVLRGPVQGGVASRRRRLPLWRLGFRPVGTVPLEAYRRYERWVLGGIRREGGVDMATNVTQRNEVLRELLRWHLEKGGLAANRLFDGVTPPRQADVVCGELRAHTESSNHILSMLGYPDALPPAGRCPR